MDIILIAGLWLPSSAWEPVTGELESLGHRPIPVPLPGADDGSTEATHRDQVDAVLAAVDGASNPYVVGHSAACTLAWIAADRRPKGVSGVAMIGGFPASDGKPYFDGLQATDGLLEFPGWEAFEGPDSDDLDEDDRQKFEAMATPVPQGVIDGTVSLSDDRRFDVPVVLICPEFSPDDAREWMDAGYMPEFERTASLSMVNIDSGHWPMLSKPSELAAIIAEAATSTQ